MKTHGAKTSALLLTVLFALTLPSSAQNQAQLPGMEPLEGIAAKLDNDHALRDAITSFEKGLVAVESVITSEGLRRADALRWSIRNNKSNGESSSQLKLEEAVTTLRLCKDSCQAVEESCRNSADANLNILLATSCQASSGRCQIACAQDLLGAVSSMRDPRISAQGYENENQLDQQREEAKIVILRQDLEDKRILFLKGVRDLQRVALKEGIRTTLQEYKEYGVPPGATAIETAFNDLKKCTKANLTKEAICESIGLSDDVECWSDAAHREIDCLVATIRRYIP